MINMTKPYKYQSFNIVDGNKVLSYFVNCKDRVSAENIMRDEMFYNGNTEEQIEGAVSRGSFNDNTVLFIIKTIEE